MMKVIGIKSFVNENGTVEFVKIERVDTDGTKKRMTIKIGDEFIVIPDNSRSMKHRDRKVVVKKFVKNEQHGELKAGVQFLDNMRPGKVRIEDLKKIYKK